MTTRIRTYSEFRRLGSFEERYRYLALRGNVGQATFGFDRYLNQRFYTSRQWRQLRFDVIARDNACDLGMTGYDVTGKITIHHMNPVTVSNLVQGDDEILNPEFLISVTHQTHNAIHYGDEKLLRQPFVERHSGDTVPWRRRD